jgi:hypothetical protein
VDAVRALLTDYDLYASKFPLSLEDARNICGRHFCIYRVYQRCPKCGGKGFVDKSDGPPPVLQVSGLCDACGPIRFSLEQIIADLAACGYAVKKISEAEAYER